MANLATREIKAFVPARDFELSISFYQSLGFAVGSVFGEVAYLSKGECAFLLQDFYETVHCENYMMHLLVEDARSWHQHVAQSGVETEFGTTLTELQQQPWGMLEFCMTDPSGVLWRIAEHIRTV